VRENIHAIEYEQKPGAIDLKWDKLQDVHLEQEPEVVMVTQTTVTRYDVRIPVRSMISV
jgi:hypothetical protein